MEIGPFDPAQILQSLSTSKYTGSLTVFLPTGHQLEVWFESGTIIAANLDGLCGDDAIVRYLCAFDQSTCLDPNIQLTKMTLEELPELPSEFRTKKTLVQLVFAAAALQNNDA